MVSALLVLVGQLTAHDPAGWDLAVEFPRFSAGGAAARRANATAKARERLVFQSFLRRSKREVPALRGKVTTARYELKVTPHRITDRPGLASGYVETYTYLAGAHGTTQYEAINDGPRGPLRLRSLFRPRTDAVGEASRALVAIMKAMPDVPSSVKDGTWARLTPQQADRFVVGPNGLLFLFDQYDVGYGAQGAPKVLVPFSKLPSLDRNRALRAVL